jgi:hypothetical protein
LLALFGTLSAGKIHAQTGGSGGAAGTTTSVPKPVFPQWVRDLRRGEIIAFGAFPFTMFLTTVIWDTYKWGHYDDFSWANRRYAPWPVKPAGAERLDNDEFIRVMGIAAGAAIIIAITDHILIRVRRTRAARAAARLPPGDVRIERRPWPETGSSPPGAEDPAEAAPDEGDAAAPSSPSPAPDTP